MPSKQHQPQHQPQHQGQLDLRCIHLSTQSFRTQVAPMCAKASSTAMAPPSATARQARALAGRVLRRPRIAPSQRIASTTRQTQTNNRAELMAMIRAIQLCPNDGRRLAIQTDSQYSKDCVEKWLPKWQKRGGRHHSARMCRIGILSNSLLTSWPQDTRIPRSRR